MDREAAGTRAVGAWERLDDRTREIRPRSGDGRFSEWMQWLVQGNTNAGTTGGNRRTGGTRTLPGGRDRVARGEAAGLGPPGYVRSAPLSPNGSEC